MPAIAVRDLTFDYADTRALDSVSFEIEAGTITALVGPNGAGKTTLLNCIAGLAEPISGSIHIDGLSVLDNPRECHAMLGYLPDYLGLYSGLTVWQCLTYVALAQGLLDESVEFHVKQVSERVGLKNRLTSLVRELSRGLRQRLAIGQALIHEPGLLVLDEPASGLDPEARSQLASLLRTLQDEGKTLVVSSHILSELEDYSTHMLILRDGKVFEHSAIGAGSGTQARCLELVLSREHPAAKEIVERDSRTSAVKLMGLTLCFEFVGGDQEQHTLLKYLFEHDVPVCSLAVVQRDLQQEYVRKISSASDEEKLGE